MTGKNETERAALDRLADALVEDILNVSDEDILAEFAEQGGDARQHAEKMRSLFEATMLVTNKRRMAAAKAGVAATRRASHQPPPPTVDIAEARARLRTLVERSSAPSNLTLAARKEEELSNADILGMLEDLAELGIVAPKNGDGEES